VWAVGAYDPDSSPTILRTFALHYDGSAWSIVPTPNMGPQLNTLQTVAEASDGTAWAVGYYVDPVTFWGRQLILRWNGANWSIPSYPAPGISGQLYGVAARTPSDIWAVGDTQATIGALATLVEHFDGSTWSVIPSPNPGNAGNVLYGVLANAADDVWAVGSQTIKGGPDQALILHWNGTAWTHVEPRRDGSANTNLYAVVMTPYGPEAVGEAEDDIAGRDLVFAAAGTAFDTVPVGMSRAGDDRLQAAAAAPGGEWGVGSTTDWLGVDHPNILVEYHAKTAAGWRIVRGPKVNTSDDNQLGGVAVIGGKPWIVGWVPGPNGDHTLIAKGCN
jgi:hypothetical protein